MTNVSDEIPSSDLPVEFDISRELQLLRLRDNTLEDYVSDARHEWQSRMLRALDCGYEGLALEILHRDSKLSDWWQGGYLGSSLTKNGIKDLPRAAFSDVIEILMTISNEGNAGMLRNLIEGRIGHCLFERSEFLPLPLNHRVLSYMDEADRKSAYRPVIYALIHSDENGNAPTIHEYGRVLRRMRQYINTDEARWAVNDEYAEEVNYAGRATHEALPADRDWSVGATRNPKWMQFPHPRRYASNESSLKSIATFIKYFTHRIDTKIKHTAPNESLPWHLTYIGWTNKFERRQAEHYRHALGQDIKNLVETITFLEYPHRKYFMRMFPITNVCSPAMVRAEHVISLLTCSYAKLGGLNGVSGGSSKDTASASSNPQGCWDAGLSAIASQEDQFKDTLDEYYRQVKIDRFFEKVKDTGGDIQVLEKELGTLKDLTEIQLVEEAKEFEQVCERRLSECRQDEADVAQFIKDMRFVQEADEVIEEYPEIVEDSQP